jgi:hypothetical protein
MNDEQWLAFLLKPENLPCALEIGSNYIPIKHAVLDDLFARIESGLNKHLKAKSAADTWLAYRDKASDDWPAVYTWPKNHPDECPGVYVRLERGAYQKQSRMVLGAGTITGRTQLDPKSVQPLIKAMEERDFSITQQSWVRRRWLEYYPEDHDFCVDAMSSNQIEKDLVAAITDTFDAFRESMELVNQRERTRFRAAKK